MSKSVNWKCPLCEEQFKYFGEISIGKRGLVNHFWICHQKELKID